MHRFLFQIAVSYTVHRLIIRLGGIELNIALLAGLLKIEYVYTDVHTIISLSGLLGMRDASFSCPNRRVLDCASSDGRT